MKKAIMAALACLITALPALAGDRNESLVKQQQINFVKDLLQEKDCIVQALWFEARGESYRGIKAVASVLHNRVNSGLYPDSYCRVVKQPSQFSYIKQRKQAGLSMKVRAKRVEQDKLQFIENLALKMVLGQFKPIVPETSLWYAHRSVENHWTTKKRPVARIGQHVFYVKK